MIYFALLACDAYVALHAICKPNWLQFSASYFLDLSWKSEKRFRADFQLILAKFMVFYSIFAVFYDILAEFGWILAKIGAKSGV